jgi:hypothetical protein
MSFFYRATEANVLKNGKLKLYLCYARGTTLIFLLKTSFASPVEVNFGSYSVVPVK